MTEDMTCPACRSGQVKRRGEPLCPACEQAALEVPRRPVWVLDSPLLRRVLAEVNVPAVVAVIRAACGLSQRDMAEVAGWSRAALSYYERGRREAVFDIRALLQFADAIGMPRPALLPLVLADPGAGNGGWGADPEQVACTGLPGESRLRYWQACADTLHERIRQAGGTALLRPAVLLWRQVGEMRAGAQSTRVRATAAAIALLAGEAALDGDSLVLARSLQDAMRDLAADAGDTVLAVRVMLAQSVLRAVVAEAEGSREPARQTLLLAREAAEEARYEPIPQLHALIAIRHARAAALLGDKPVFGAAIARARRELDRARPDGAGLVPTWLKHFGVAEVTAAEAAGSLHLGEAEQSAALYRQALDQAGCPRDRALLASELAHALASHGERGQAVSIALDIALPTLEAGVTSARCIAGYARSRHRPGPFRGRWSYASESRPSAGRSPISRERMRAHQPRWRACPSNPDMAKHPWTGPPILGRTLERWVTRQPIAGSSRS
jgi:transcriptional regulator with XRE-family HTH domain